MAIVQPLFLRGLARSMRVRNGEKRPVLAGHKLLYRCNLECQMCPFWRREDEQMLSLRDEVRMMDALVRADVLFMGFEGGEPLLRTEVVPILRESHDRFHTSIVTNGWLLEKRLPEIRRHVDHVFVSLDGIGPLHDFLRGIRGSYDRAVGGIRASAQEVDTAISSTITKDNLHQAEGLVELAEELGVPISFQVAYDYSTAAPMSPMGPALQETLETLRAMKSRGAPILQSPEYFTSVIDSWYRGIPWRCRPWLTINIDPQGRVVLPCYTLQEYHGDLRVWDADIRRLWNEFDWRSFESCNKCALACYLEPSLFSWSNLPMVRERIVLGALQILRRKMGMGAPPLRPAGRVPALPAT